MSDASSTSAAETMAETTASDAGDEPWFPGALSGGCPPAWTGADVVGETELGAFVGKTALFAYVPCLDSEALSSAFLEIAIFDEGVDFAAAKRGEGARLHLSPDWWYTSDRQWLERGADSAFLTDGADSVNFSVHLTIRAKSGNWDAFDPLDPPVLHGSIESEDPSGPRGSFDAAFCGARIAEPWCPD
ncbi:MAG: hypothetical protein KC486_34990 [Myxococcales bacterium]|nr:hypothetical protein [Myxococcales bacterium]